jgi:crossover junction endodeoxyribonuclease RusA
MILEFHVPGVAVPQGSLKGFLVRGKVRLTSDNPRLKRWRRDVSWAAAAALQQHAGPARTLLRGGVRVDALFVLPRPDDVEPGAEHVRKPDVDKLLRGVLDALTAVVWVDDSQVCDAHPHKRYVTATERPHVVVKVAPAAGTPLLEGL